MNNPTIKYPNITVSLLDGDGNAFSILGKVHRALQKAKISHGEIEEFLAEATDGNYNHLLRTCMKWVNVE